MTVPYDPHADWAREDAQQLPAMASELKLTVDKAYFMVTMLCQLEGYDLIVESERGAAVMELSNYGAWSLRDAVAARHWSP